MTRKLGLKSLNDLFDDETDSQLLVLFVIKNSSITDYTFPSFYTLNFNCLLENIDSSKILTYILKRSFMFWISNGFSPFTSKFKKTKNIYFRI